MKKPLATSVLVLASGCSHGENYSYSQLPYFSKDPSVIGVIKVDVKGNILLGGENNNKQNSFIQSIDSDGNLNWEYIPPGESSNNSASIKLADAFQASDRSYVVCTNHYPTAKNPSLFSTLHYLTEKGEFISSVVVPPPKNEYNGNVLVEKCWGQKGDLYILGTIYGGRNYRPNGNPGTIYWLRKISNGSSEAKDFIFASRMTQRANINEIFPESEEIIYVAHNGVQSEIVSFNLSTGKVNQSTLPGKANLIKKNKELNVITFDRGEINLVTFDDKINRLKTSNMKLDFDDYVIAGIGLPTGKLAIISSTLTSGSNKLKISETDLSLSYFESRSTRTWSPTAIFAPVYHNDSDGGYTFQFKQFNNGKKQFYNNILKIKVK